MSYSKEVYLAARDRLSERRRQALTAADIRREQLYHDIPRLKEINTELQSIGASVAKTVVKKDADDDTIRKLSKRSLALQEEQDRILSEKGIDLSVMEPHYSCDKCGDTGYLEQDNRTVICDCLNHLMSQIACEQLNADLPLRDCTFESFSLEFYSDEPDEKGRSALNRMTKIYRHCVDYADHFSLNSRSLLMRGATGLGKTHLSLAIANEVIRKGWSVVYVSAPEILSKLEREHFSYQYSQQEDTFNSLLRCDLLIIDDLGTEFITPFSTSCIYNLFNSRLQSGKPQIISTNMTMTELLNAYSQRFVSRVLGSCDKLDFLGEDIRQMK